MGKKRCFFIGHREAAEALYPALQKEVYRHILELGVREFIVGHYGEFDRLAARSVAAAKKVWPEIQLWMLLAYHPAERPILLPSGFDGTYYPPGMERVPRRFAICRANRYMVDHVDHLIAYAWHPASNAMELVTYAQRRVNRGELHLTVLPHDPISHYK